MIKEYLLSVGSFSKPKGATEMKAVGILIIRLFEMMPGTNPLHPKMGVGLSRYRHIQRDQLPELEALIVNQMSTYLPPSFQDVKVSLSFGQYLYLQINMLINGVNYQYDTADSNTPVQLSEVVEK